MGRCRNFWTGSLSTSEGAIIPFKLMDSYTPMGCLLVLNGFGFTIAIQWNIDEAIVLGNDHFKRTIH